MASSASARSSSICAKACSLPGWMVKPIAEQPRRSASATDPVTACALLVARLFELFSFRMGGIWPAKLAAPASIMPSGAA